ncbi:hypothetical protein [Noviherbaspirillum cavernae]|uniref:hypothetical protein n=1 Tax=Noviherbaspirillum cavernae TaxID=2320862 RepID=UPI0011C41017|nr:hypothetical protein [Noviherbaspirillum cavernae]
MIKEFNFLTSRTQLVQAADTLRRQNPARSEAWIQLNARRIALDQDITKELRAPERTAAAKMEEKQR